MMDVHMAKVIFVNKLSLSATDMHLAFKSMFRR